MKRSRVSVAVLLTAAWSLVLAGNASAVTERGSASAPAGPGTLRVSFVDEWRGSGMVTWTIDSSRSTAEWVYNGLAPGQVELKLKDEYCFSKYGFDEVAVSGGGISPGGVSAQKDCGSREGAALEDIRSVTNSGSVIGRGNPYGRWLWMQHRSQASLRVGSSNYFVEAYDRSAPMGGDV